MRLVDSALIVDGVENVTASSLSDAHRDARLVCMARRKRKRAAVQVEIDFRARGGKRRGAGRKPRGARPLVSHATRAFETWKEPILVTLKVLPGIWSLRARRMIGAMLAALAVASDHLGVRIVHFSVQRDHIHLIVEAKSKLALSRAMQGLSVRIARAINRVMGRRGAIFADRFHSRVLSSPRQVRNALKYVLCNAAKHGERLPVHHRFDPCSSALSFDGWLIDHDPVPGITAAPRTWLLRRGWRRDGPFIDPRAIPGPLRA